MKQVNFKGEKLSKMGFGTLRLPLDQTGKSPDYEKIEKMVDLAIRGGVNYFDTGYSYALEKAEIALGRALKKYPRDSYFIADKLPTWRCKSPQDVNKIFEHQLKKCGVDYFDFYLIHSIKEKRYEEIEKYEVIERLMKEKQNGRIKYFGASCHCGPKLLYRLLETYGNEIEFIQLQINYMDWEFGEAKELYEIAAEFEKPVMVMEALRGGMLANPLSTRARKILDNIGGNYPSLGYRFVNSLENVAVTLSGVACEEDVEENLRIFEQEVLSETQKNTILEAARKLAEDVLIPCTGCDYCNVCPQEIKISKIFAVYNEAAASNFNRPWLPLSKDYKAFESNANNCLQCGMCESHCPQNIKIIDWLRKIDKKYIELEKEGK